MNTAPAATDYRTPRNGLAFFRIPPAHIKVIASIAVSVLLVMMGAQP